jgi:hypothetical protein
MKAWIAGSVVTWTIAAAGLLGVIWWGLSPAQRNAVRPELEAELAVAVPNPPVFGHPLFHFHIAAPWLDPDHHVRWHTLPADVVWRALHSIFSTSLLVVVIHIAIISALQGLLATVALWAAIRGACGGAGWAPVAPLGRTPGGR